jgi:hypothetical protein
MAWTAAQLLAWLDEVEPRAAGRSHFEWLELPPTTAPEAIQRAYHAIARTRHPDLFRAALRPADLDRLVRMYARVTGAYAELRTADSATAYLRRHAPAVTSPASPRVARAPRIAHVTRVARTSSRAERVGPGAVDPARAMNARALALYRRAEGALRTGDRASAILNIKMAIAADPSSQLLRGALAELTRT